MKLLILIMNISNEFLEKILSEYKIDINLLNMILLKELLDEGLMKFLIKQKISILCYKI